MTVMWVLLAVFMLAELLVAFHVVKIHEAVEGTLVITTWTREWIVRAIERIAASLE